MFTPPRSPFIPSETTPVPERDDAWADAWTLINNVARSGWLIYAVAGLLAVLLVLSLRSRRKRAKVEASGGVAELTATDRAITRITGILATAVVATGAWKVFGDVLHLHWTFKVVLFFFAEAQIVAAWRRVGRHIRRHHTLGRGIRTIYGIALGSALVAAFDADSGVEVLLRFFAAGVAAYMIAEELAEELDIHLEKNPAKRTAAKRQRGRIKWALDLERILVWLRLAQATEQSIEDVERRRRIARFARTAYRLHHLKDDNAWKWRINLVRWQLRRQTQSASEHLGLATNANLIGDARAQLALMYGVEAGTTKAAVMDLNPLDNGRKAITMSGHLDTLSGQDMDNLLDNLGDRLTGHLTDILADTKPDTAPDIEPDSDPTPAPDSDRTEVPDTQPDSTPDTLPDAGTDTVPDTEEPSAPDTAPDIERPADPTPRRPRRRTSSPTPKWTKEQLKAFRLRDTRPDMTYPMIAREVGVSEKTVSRWFARRDEAEKALRETQEATVPTTPIPSPKPDVLAGVNGYHPTTTEEN